MSDHMLYAGNNLSKARELFAAAIKHRPRIRLTRSARPSSSAPKCSAPRSPAVWNYCGEIQEAARRQEKRWPSAFDLIKLTTGCSIGMSRAPQGKDEAAEVSTALQIILKIDTLAVQHEGKLEPFAPYCFSSSRWTPGGQGRRSGPSTSKPSALALGVPGDWAWEISDLALLRTIVF
jgi:hypothetical protein